MTEFPILIQLDRLELTVQSISAEIKKLYEPAFQVLPVSKGGTGATTAADARTALGVTPANIGAAAATHSHAISDVSELQTALDGKSPTGHKHSTADITSGTLAVARGGTGQTTVRALRNSMGLGNTTGALPLANGGTGAVDAANALKNIGAAAASHNHSAANITSGTLAVARGGTGQTTVKALRNSMGLGNTTSYLPIANGGTGKNTAATALAALGGISAVFQAGTSAPRNTKLLWIDTNTNGGLKYYNGKAWVAVPVIYT